MLTYRYDEHTKELLFSEEGFLYPLETELQGKEIPSYDELKELLPKLEIIYSE